MKIKYELMREQDCQEVAQLLQANSQSQNGGLLGEYPLHKVNAMYLDSLSTFIARSNNLIVGVVFSFSTSSTTLPPLAHFIIDNYQPLLFNSWLYGPVCIHKDFRGNHILEGLYQHICATNSGRPIAFINASNIQSLKAHKKLNMNEIERFVFNQTAYILVQGQ